MTTEDKIITVAKYFVMKSQKEFLVDPSKTLTPLKLQKVLYYAKVWNLIFNKGEKLFPDDFQAWIHGPANPKVWEYFRDFDFAKPHPEIESQKFENINDAEKEILDMVWSVYGKFDGKYLEMLTHSEEPWLRARGELNTSVPSQNTITDESIVSYYEQRIKEEEPA